MPFKGDVRIYHDGGGLCARPATHCRSKFAFSRLWMIEVQEDGPLDLLCQCNTSPRRESDDRNLR